VRHQRKGSASPLFLSPLGQSSRASESHIIASTDRYAPHNLTDSWLVGGDQGWAELPSLMSTEVSVHALQGIRCLPAAGQDFKVADRSR
jgi:hypothetical protein